jgi:hypothetical protein
MSDNLITPQQAENRQPTCADRIDDHFESRMDDLRKLWSAYCLDECPECDGTGEAPNPDHVTESSLDEPALDECKLCKGTGELDEDSYGNELGNLYEYGLCFDYVGPERGRPGYFRYQLSWGGPSDEFRIYAEKISEWQWTVWKIEYFFQDWFDSAHKVLTGDDLNLIEEIFEQFFASCGTASACHLDTMKDYEFDDEEDED